MIIGCGTIGTATARLPLADYDLDWAQILVGNLGGQATAIQLGFGISGRPFQVGGLWESPDLAISRRR